VGVANGANPISLVVPCHRAIGSDGSLTGYAGGLDRKRWLLRHEGAAFREKLPRGTHANRAGPL
jgi:methylated-DNA-[protein]-cysteine S-methyltransferase